MFPLRRSVVKKSCHKARAHDDATTTKTTENFRKKRSVAQIKDQVVRMKTHTESSKSELSSRGKQPFKVFVQNFNKKVSMSPLFKKVATRTGEGNIELALSTISVLSD